MNELQQRVTALMARTHELESAAAAGTPTHAPAGRKHRLGSRSSSRNLTAAVNVSIDDVTTTLRDKVRRSHRGSTLDKQPSGPPARAVLPADEIDVASHCSDDFQVTPSQLSVSQLWPDEAPDSLAHLSLSQQELSALVHSATPAAALADGCQVLHARLNGTDVRVWRLTVDQSVSATEVSRAIASMCIAHPNIATLLGVAVEATEGQMQDAPEHDAEDEPCAGEPGSCVWLVEERHGSGETLAARLERGFLSWQHAVGLAKDVCRALAYAQAVRRPTPTTPAAAAGDLHRLVSAEDSMDEALPALLGATSLGVSAAGAVGIQAVASMATPCNVMVDQTCAKVSLVPALLVQLMGALGLTCTGGSGGGGGLPLGSQLLPFAYVDPARMFGSDVSSSPAAAYAYAVTLLQLVTEQQPQGLLGACREALASGTLSNFLPRLPVSPDTLALAERMIRLALTCAGVGATPAAAPAAALTPNLLEAVALPELEAVSADLTALGSAAMSWEHIESLVLRPLQPEATEPAARRWVRADFRVRHKAFLEEVRRAAAQAQAEFTKLSWDLLDCPILCVPFSFHANPGPNPLLRPNTSAGGQAGRRQPGAQGGGAPQPLLQGHHGRVRRQGPRRVAPAAEGHLHRGGGHGLGRRVAGVVLRDVKGHHQHRPRPAVPRRSVSGGVCALNMSVALGTRGTRGNPCLEQCSFVFFAVGFSFLGCIFWAKGRLLCCVTFLSGCASMCRQSHSGLVIILPLASFLTTIKITLPKLKLPRPPLHLFLTTSIITLPELTLALSPLPPAAGATCNQLYIHPLASSPSHLKKFHFVGLFMAKAILESAKELGPVSLNLPLAEPFWKLLLGLPLCLQASARGGRFFS